MKSLFVHSLLLSGYFLGVTVCYPAVFNQRAIAQVSILPIASEELYYTFNGKKIPLTLREDLVGVEFKQGGSSRSLNVGSANRLKQDLQGGSRSVGLNVEVQVFGNRFALVNIPSGTRSTTNNLIQRVKQFSYVEDTLPVLTRKDRNETIVLPNEIIVTFESEILDEEAQKLVLERFDLEVLRKMPFTQNRFVVRARSASGTAILKLANRLSQVQGIQTATPNFIQSVQYGVPLKGFNDSLLKDTPNPSAFLKQELSNLKAEPVVTPFQSDLLPLQWHLDSRPRRGQLQPRIDLHAVEAWKAGHSGKGVVVAVIDSLIQWDHPDLTANLHKLPSVADPLPGEQGTGYDFAQGDGDTRISSVEIAQLQPFFQDTFKLSCPAFSQKYSSLIVSVESSYPDLSKNEICPFTKNLIRNQIAAEFHGTWSAGVIAANGQGTRGIFGVAPNAKFLPVRVFGLGGSISSENLASAIRYSAARKADVINMSLGSRLPNDEIVAAIFEVLDKNPQLVIVASAGNDNVDGVGFPSGIPGVISVGSTNLQGYRAPYSSYGAQLDLVAPGGDTSQVNSGGILTAGGTFVEGFWTGIPKPDYAWAYALDPQGTYVQVQGTSFSGPAVAGVVALIKDVNPRLRREKVFEILKTTSSSQSMKVSEFDINQYRLQIGVGFGTERSFRPSGIFPLPDPVNLQQYYFGSGLVNAEAAVKNTPPQ